MVPVVSPKVNIRDLCRQFIPKKEIRKFIKLCVKYCYICYVICYPEATKATVPSPVGRRMYTTTHD